VLHNVVRNTLNNAEQQIAYVDHARTPALVKPTPRQSPTKCGSRRACYGYALCPIPFRSPKYVLNSAVAYTDRPFKHQFVLHAEENLSTLKQHCSNRCRVSYPISSSLHSLFPFHQSHDPNSRSSIFATYITLPPLLCPIPTTSHLRIPPSIPSPHRALTHQKKAFKIVTTNTASNPEKRHYFPHIYKSLHRTAQPRTPRMYCSRGYEGDGDTLAREVVMCTTSGRCISYQP
jgi:hypothetical protein